MGKSRNLLSTTEGRASLIAIGLTVNRLFAAAGATPPATTDELLAAAKRFMQPDRQHYGISWNGPRGQALGQQLANFYAGFGQRLPVEGGIPTLHTPQALAAARYAQTLPSYSLRDVLNMAWNQQTGRFGHNGCAMSYGWAVRAPILVKVYCDMLLDNMAEQQSTAEAQRQTATLLSAIARSGWLR